MAKQRGSSRRPTPPAADKTRRKAGPPARGRRPGRLPNHAPSEAEPEVRPGYTEAVAAYERGLRDLQQHAYAEAAREFRTVLERFPDEKELHERARLYLNVCDRHLAKARAPQTVQERLYAATVAINRGSLDEAISLLSSIVEEQPEHDHALYMLAVACVERNDLDRALLYLARAVRANPENGRQARRDPDLASLRPLDAFRDLVG